MFTPLISATLEGTWQTIYMVLLSGTVAVLAGVPLGVILATTRSQGILHHTLLHRGLGFIVDLVRAIPFIILLLALIPLTRLIVGTSIGTMAAIVPLSIGAIPFVARLVESALSEVDGGLIEAGQSMGASAWQIIWRILLPEACPSITRGITITLVSLVGYSAMAGAVGGGGLGSLAINYGYQRFDFPLLFVTIVVLVALVYAIQWVGDSLVKRFER